MMLSAALVTLLVSASVPLIMMMAAFMPLTVVMSVVVTFGIGIIFQPALGQRKRRCVRGTSHTAVEPDSSLGQRVLRAHTDPTANKCIHLRSLQESS
jgi:hypothetical protein